MCKLEQFDIDLKALTEETTPLEWQLDESFFSMLDDAQLQQGSLHVSGSIRKASGFYELLLQSTGTVIVPCDRCLEPMDQPIDASLHLTVRLGSVSTKEEDDVVTVDEASGVLNAAWLIYESIVLAVPIQHVHQLGGCNDAMMRVLEKHSAVRGGDADAQAATDPRWDALKGLDLSK